MLRRTLRLDSPFALVRVMLWMCDIPAILGLHSLESYLMTLELPMPGLRILGFCAPWLRVRCVGSNLIELCSRLPYKEEIESDSVNDLHKFGLVPTHEQLLFR